ncbi:protein-disulfide reductase DsbD family protein [Aquincola tertiaricarbonis]|uniref:protein-disulfide reductase DsbD family protein n=1 Tax=Aquincola tertiaricarbonis TaxID=391953 RepID=UPI000615082B|nr:thioredoxin family protein [Aquincola tertiaricarbonis]
MLLPRVLLSLAFVVPCSAHAVLFGGSPAVVKTDQVRVELVAHAPDGVQAGKPVWLGLKITHEPHWHTYWKNPGDSGLPTTLQWTLPTGLQAGEVAWPTPKKLPVGPLVNYGYEDTLLLPVPLTVPAGFAAPTVEVKLHAEWLVCKEVCIPQSGDFTLALPAQAATAANAADFDAAQRRMPAPLPQARATATLSDTALQLRIAGLPAAWQGRAVEFFPETAGVVDNAARITAQWQGDAWQAAVPLSAQRSESPARMAAVLVAAGVPAGVQVAFDVPGPWPDPALAAAAPPAPAHEAGAQATPSGTSLGWAGALLLALGGGMLLNLMPCVFPVLSLKVLGFASHAHDGRARVGGGLAYTAGVVLSFLALAGVLLALRAGGEQLGWGFQLQSPSVVAALAALFTLIGLNLAGVFEFGSVLPGNLASLRARHPMADSFLTGVLAVAVASPCTAPFMGASLGLAVTLPAAQALAVFGALGLGMALPYLAASLWPAAARALPRPGVWMLRFKVLMAFPMFATVVWLVWVLGQQAGIDAVAALLGLLLALAFAAWAWGGPGFGRTARLGFGGVSALLLAAALAWALPALREPPADAPVATAGIATGAWEPWSAARVAELTAQGRPVFVDFTAAWCVTCQFNKRGTLADAQVMADFQARDVALLRADWTRRDAAIGAELTRLGRSGVPVYALYRPGAGGGAPQLLPEILTAQAVREALGRL